MSEVVLTLTELGMVLAAAILLALLPGADLAKLGLALLYRKSGMNPAYAEAVQEGEDAEPDEGEG